MSFVRTSIAALTLALFVAGCSSYRGELRHIPFSGNHYKVLAKRHHKEVVVSAPAGWKLDPTGAPVYLGSFIHPNYPTTCMVISVMDDPVVTSRDSQGTLLAREIVRARKEEPELLAVGRRIRSGSTSSVGGDPAPKRDPVRFHHLSDVRLADGRAVRIYESDSPVTGQCLTAFIPENGFVAKFLLPVHEPSHLKALRSALESTVASYQIRRTGA